MGKPRGKESQMEKHRLILVLLAVAICSLVLTGCGKKELEQAKAETAQAKLELANTQGLLAKSEHDNEKLQAEFDAVIEEQKKLQGLVATMSKERDEAMAKAKQFLSNYAALKDEDTKLKTQIGGLMKNIAGLQTDKEKLEATIKELQDKLKDVKLPSLPKI
ncbi:MAG: hypothetical protein ACW963_10080 [Candidatus Sifarchaeia archaeon]|jgi:chromosome segregation ATPase